jgi:hypothetical protein
MATELGRMTFAVTPEIAARLDNLKKYIFYNRSQSEMLRTLIMAGISAIQTDVDQHNKQGVVVPSAQLDGAVPHTP